MLRTTWAALCWRIAGALSRVKDHIHQAALGIRVGHFAQGRCGRACRPGVAQTDGQGSFGSRQVGGQRTFLLLSSDLGQRQRG